MPLPVQAALLRFLQDGRYIPVGGTREKKVDVRVIAATQPVLDRRVADGGFRADLYYRLAEVVIRAPTLRDIPGDLPYIVKHIVYGMADRAPKADIPSTLGYFHRGGAKLRSHPWHGNVRELAALVKRRLLLGDDVLRELHPPTSHGPSVPSPAVPLDAGSIRPIDDVVQDYVKAVWNNRGALTQLELAKKLGKSMNTVRRIVRGH